MEPLSTVVLLCDLPERNLSRGQVAAVVECLAPEVYEIEFRDDEGRTYASLAVPGVTLIQLHHQPVPEAA